MVFDKWYLIKSISAVTNYNSSSCFNCIQSRETIEGHEIWKNIQCLNRQNKCLPYFHIHFTFIITYQIESKETISRNSIEIAGSGGFYLTESLFLAMFQKHTKLFNSNFKTFKFLHSYFYLKKSNNNFTSPYHEIFLKSFENQKFDHSSI